MFEKYEINFQKKYGSGGYGVTVAAKDKATGENLAVKLIDTGKQKVPAIQKECNIMSMIDHPNVIKCKDHGPGEGQYQRFYFIFMEVASGGELFDQVIDRGAAAMPETVARGYFNQILNAVRVCHHYGIAHRDLKLENVLLNDKGVVKVIDFGLSHIYPRGADGKVDLSKPLKDVCGSKSYAAPEVLAATPYAGYEGFKCDAWSLGVCLFAMVSGFFPLDEASANDWRYDRLRAEQARGASTTGAVYGFYRRTTGHLSRELIDLLDKLLTIDPSKRLGLEEASEHPWVKEQTFPAPPPNTVVDPDEYPVYRSVGVGSLAASQMPMDVDEEMPVYRSLGGLGGEEDMPMPGLVRQNANFDLRMKDEIAIFGEEPI